MSRNIESVGVHDETDKMREEQTAQEGRLLFTRYQGKESALLIRENRLLAMQALSRERNRVGAVYVGRIQRVASSMEALFVEIADGEVCFLPNRYARTPLVCNRSFHPETDQLREGDELLVQIQCDARKTKQPIVTTAITLANEVAAVNLGYSKIKYSRKLSKDSVEQLDAWLAEEGLLKQSYPDLTRYGDGQTLPTDAPVPEEMPQNTASVIVRTRAGDCDRETFLRELDKLLGELTTLCKNASHRTCFSCVREAEPAFAVVLNKLVAPEEYAEIVTDLPEYYEALSQYCENRLFAKPVRLYQDEMLSLFKLYALESKCKTAFDRRVWLKSGGYLIIDHTEALTVIDVNSGKDEGGRDSSENAYMVNMEAAKEVALQIRLRNLSGIIIVDFINMRRQRDNARILVLLRRLAKQDRLNMDVVDMTPLGLVEITRKKEEKPLREQFLQDRGGQE
ncbi:MAG: ribonuclease E/G [Candidatus Gastranaerophilales bacterium]|nr:ribonuclease E/G [Candidatus Gastranaerophilales bacterium]